MKKPDIVCPACKEVYLKSTRDEYVSICGIIYAQYEVGMSDFENYTITPIHCEKDRYTKCQVWRGEKEAGWQRKEGERFSSLEQAEAIRL